MTRGLRFPGIILAALLLTAHAGWAQSAGASAAAASDLAVSTNFAIPSAPAFVLLDVTPALVRTPTFPRDFSLDWVLKEDALASNIAITAAPVWLLAFGDVSAAEYRALDPVSRTLSTLNISVGTAEKNSTRHLAVGATLNLLRDDPLLDRSYIMRLERAVEFVVPEVEFELSLANLSQEASADLSPSLADSFRAIYPVMITERVDYTEVRSYRNLSEGEQEDLAPYLDRAAVLVRSLHKIEDSQIADLRAIMDAYEETHWNSSRIGVGAGVDVTYASPELGNLQFESSGFGGWLNGATGLGTQHLLAGAMGRGIYREGVWEWFLGANLRAGRNDKAHLFVEFVREWLPDGDLNIIAYGGAVRLSERIYVQFGLRHTFDADLDPVSLLPLIKVNGRVIPSIF